jgi:serine/threonine-protein kinase ATR
VDILPHIGQSWLLSAKLARKAGYAQTAYSAVLQAQQLGTPFSFIESAKLTRVGGEPLRALRELENSLSLARNVIDLTVDEGNQQQLRAKVSFLCYTCRPLING